MIYQRSLRDIQEALKVHIKNYYEVLKYISRWADIPFRVTCQKDLFSNSERSEIVRYVVERHIVLGEQLSPK